MLKLAEAGENDIVFDLGCGWAQNLILAVKEFKVKKCVGIERLEERVEEAKDKVKQWKLSKKIDIIKGEFQDLIEGKSKEARDKNIAINDATIILYFLETDKNDICKLSEKLQEGCRLVYYYRALIPEIKPDAADYPFYVTKFPFKSKRPSSVLDWLRRIVQKEKSSFDEDKTPYEEELWAELSHDYNVLHLDKEKEIKEYKRRLKIYLKQR